MRKRLAPVLFVLLLGVLVIDGCTRSPSAASLSRGAVARSNQEAKRLYNIEPFKSESGQLRTEGQQIIWEALTSSGGHDMTARVTYDERGVVVGVEVKMLTHPEPQPATNFNNLQQLLPPKTQQEKHGIPEAMPK